MPSSRSCGGCKAGCAWFEAEGDTKCWGEVSSLVANAHEGYLHACEGHAGFWDGEPYRPEPNPEKADAYNSLLDANGG